MEAFAILHGPPVLPATRVAEDTVAIPVTDFGEPSIELETRRLDVQPGEHVRTPVHVTKAGSVTDSIHLTVLDTLEPEDDGIRVSWPREPVAVEPGERTTWHVDVDVSHGLLWKQHRTWQLRMEAASTATLDQRQGRLLDHGAIEVRHQVGGLE